MNEFDSPNYCEYVWDRKSEGKEKVLKYVLIASYVAFVVAFFLICSITKVIQLFAVCPIFTWILVFFTWRLVSYDCYFELCEGMLSVGKIKVNKNGRRKKPKLKLHVKEAEYGGVYAFSDESAESGVVINPEVKNELESVKKIYDFSETQSSPHRIILIWQNAGVRSAVIFEGTAKMAKLTASLCDKAKSLKGNTLHG